MVFDDALVAAGHEDEMLDSCFACFVYRILNEGAVDNGQHLLGQGLGGGQEARPQTGDGKDGRFYAFEQIEHSIVAGR